jgi:hypothetical protein
MPHKNGIDSLQIQQWLSKYWCWNKAIPAQQKIKEIEEGIAPEYFEVFTDRDRDKVSKILYNFYFHNP